MSVCSGTGLVLLCEIFVFAFLSLPISENADVSKRRKLTDGT